MEPLEATLDVKSAAATVACETDDPCIRAAGEETSTSPVAAQAPRPEEATPSSVEGFPARLDPEAVDLDDSQPDHDVQQLKFLVLEANSLIANRHNGSGDTLLFKLATLEDHVTCLDSEGRPHSSLLESRTSVKPTFAVRLQQCSPSGVEDRYVWTVGKFIKRLQKLRSLHLPVNGLTDPLREIEPEDVEALLKREEPDFVALSVSSRDSAPTRPPKGADGTWSCASARTSMGTTATVVPMIRSVAPAPAQAGGGGRPCQAQQQRQVGAVPYSAVARGTPPVACAAPPPRAGVPGRVSSFQGIRGVGMPASPGMVYRMTSGESSQSGGSVLIRVGGDTTLGPNRSPSPYQDQRYVIPMTQGPVLRCGQSTVVSSQRSSPCLIRQVSTPIIRRSSSDRDARAFMTPTRGGREQLRHTPGTFLRPVNNVAPVPWRMANDVTVDVVSRSASRPPQA
mmetsp:Transcript_95794/g.256016  ORF Transcript_95794/g.256016 Transcript_95794/m.256016 type:complete len:453 (+) Transcript_95794:44-1402(+)